MITVVAAVIERGDRRILIGQRRIADTSPLNGNFPAGSFRVDEKPDEELARELREELGAELKSCVEIGRVGHAYTGGIDRLEIRFFAAEIAETEIRPHCFEKSVCVLPKGLRDYDFLDANRKLIAQIATGKVKPGEILQRAKSSDALKSKS
jgi:8-oxo-dGTP pyrophosphatase MutT (NUDIX family)